ncbi:hypothetical protein Pla22_25610 [Rubripirellula amarantea]|uniref:Protein nucleotidyltransferase YdiU n=2 Tax=Rubripirellula amarantea TaxID=2527999 RepID=A0A5C5WVZ2_9BACT|nr:hypothetical protein Pla22_25610 [Rubripirellula amarantea]
MPPLKVSLQLKCELVPFRFDNSYSRLPNAFFEATAPTPVRAPFLIRLNRQLTAELEGDADLLESQEGLEILSGNKIAEGAEPIATAYSGHQFGGFSPQLGDGRAVLLGEVVNAGGDRYDIQLKGSGPTPFSRRGDGRSALGPVLREYIVSEAMAALGVPTTRALAAVGTGEHVYREGPTQGGVFTRVAQSHIRIGTFQWFAARNDQKNLQVLADYTIGRHYPDARDTHNPYLTLLSRVIERQADLIAHWMQLGFIHGVMNTDNMTISGETIDYGPCAFMDSYHPAKTFSSIDHQGRYAFGNQGAIGFWNLTRFAETLLPLIDSDEKQSIAKAESALDAYDTIHREALEKRLLAKIGLQRGSSDDWSLLTTLLEAMADNEVDFTLLFRHLATTLEQGDDLIITQMFRQPKSISDWLKVWRSRIEDDQRDQAVALMRQSNPVYIPRNHRVEEAIEAGYQGDFSLFHRLIEVTQDPFHEHAQYAEYENAPLPEQIVQATFCGT